MAGPLVNNVLSNMNLNEPISNYMEETGEE